jgi:serine/threonine protein kinase
MLAGPIRPSGGIRLRSRPAMETTARSAVADYELGEAFAPLCYRARPPERLGLPSEANVLVWELGVDAPGWAELRTELSRFAAVDSPNLLRLVEAGPDLDPAGGGAYLVSEDPSGGTLESPAQRLRISEQISAVADAARGAHALHEAGIAHGSIRADNIFLSDRGGLLGPPRPAGPPGAVVRADRWQTLDGLDPDLVRGGSASRGSDVWALAATLHRVCSGASLYSGLETEQPVTAVQKVLFGVPTIHASIPPDLAEVLEACFDRDPSRRPATALELAERLDSVEVPL